MVALAEAEVPDAAVRALQSEQAWLCSLKRHAERFGFSELARTYRRELEQVDAALARLKGGT